VWGAAADLLQLLDCKAAARKVGGRRKEIGYAIVRKRAGDP
jgi:hypothetical protein